MNWNNLFYYKEGTLYYRVNVGKKIKKDSKVGNIKKNGYLQFSSKGKTYSNHRVIFEMHYGKIPIGLQIDHIDRNRLNNSIDNLRLVTNQQNSFNKEKSKKSKSLYKGVCWREDKKKWQARTKIAGVEKSLGYFDTPEAASLEYLIYTKKVQGEFACK